MRNQWPAGGAKPGTFVKTLTNCFFFVRVAGLNIKRTPTTNLVQLQPQLVIDLVKVITRLQNEHPGTPTDGLAMTLRVIKSSQ